MTGGVITEDSLTLEHYRLFIEVCKLWRPFWQEPGEQTEASTMRVGEKCLSHGYSRFGPVNNPTLVLEDASPLLQKALSVLKELELDEIAPVDR